MRISEAGKVTPHPGSTPKPTVSEGRSDGEDLDRIWQELAPRLIHPTQIKLIESLRWIGTPLSVSEFYAVLEPSETSVDYVRYHLNALCRAGVFIEVPNRTTLYSEERRYSFNNLGGTAGLFPEKTDLACQ
jgi:hypothetical protein